MPTRDYCSGPDRHICSWQRHPCAEGRPALLDLTAWPVRNGGNGGAACHKICTCGPMGRTASFDCLCLCPAPQRWAGGWREEKTGARAGMAYLCVTGQGRGSKLRGNAVGCGSLLMSVRSATGQAGSLSLCVMGQGLHGHLMLSACRARPDSSPGTQARGKTAKSDDGLQSQLQCEAQIFEVSMY